MDKTMLDYASTRVIVAVKVYEDNTVVFYHGGDSLYGDGIAWSLENVTIVKMTPLEIMSLQSRLELSDRLHESNLYYGYYTDFRGAKRFYAICLV